MSESRLSAWILAARPKTLIATVAPISIGAALAFRHESFSLMSVLVALASAMCIQVGTNLANDYYDFLKGADNAERVGPKRATQSGLIRPEVVWRGFVLCFLLAAVFGLYLIYDAGPVILWVGIASIVSGIAYTAGPWPLAYVGLGELFVLVFFGPVATGFTFYVATHDFRIEAFVFGLCPGLISCAILVANNLRDVEQDIKANKRTLAVRFGTTFAKIEYVSIWISAFLVIVVMALIANNLKLLLPLLTMPIAFLLCLKVFQNKNARELIRALEGTAKTLLLFSILLCLGIVL